MGLHAPRPPSFAPPTKWLCKLQPSNGLGARQRAGGRVSSGNSRVSFVGLERSDLSWPAVPPCDVRGLITLGFAGDIPSLQACQAGVFVNKS